MRRWSAVVLASAVVVPIALGLGGCGASSLSASQLRTGAARICGLAQRRTEHIPTPTRPSGGSSYLKQGIAALAPALNALLTLHPPGDMAGEYRDALNTTAAEVRALRSAQNRLTAGDDPVVAIKTLQRHLRPLETRAQRAWQSLAIPGCISH